MTKEQIKEFKATEKEAEDSDGYRSLADELAESGDKEWAKKIYGKAEEKGENCYEFIYLADSIYENLGDKNWSEKVYKKAEEKAEDYGDFRYLADSIYETLGDKELAKKNYKKAEEMAADSSDYESLSESVRNNLSDKKWAKVIAQKGAGNQDSQNSSEDIILDVYGWGVELVVGNIDIETAKQINEDMSWDEIEEIIGHWADIDDITHEHLLISPPTFSDKNIATNKIEAGVEEIFIKGEGYLMVTVSEEKGVFGTITVTSDTKEVNYYNKKYKIGDSYMDLVEGFNYDGKDQSLNMDDSSTVGKGVEIIIYNRKNKKQIWKG